MELFCFLSLQDLITLKLLFKPQNPFFLACRRRFERSRYEGLLLKSDTAKRFSVAIRRREFDFRYPRGAVFLKYLGFLKSVGTLSPSQPGLTLTGSVEARLLNDLYSVDVGA